MEIRNQDCACASAHALIWSWEALPVCAPFYWSVEAAGASLLALLLFNLEFSRFICGQSPRAILINNNNNNNDNNNNNNNNVNNTNISYN